ncbi:hypothetical protein D3C73_1291180 [compost metagenome]
MEQYAFEAGVLRQVFIDLGNALTRFATPGRQTHILFVVNRTASGFRIPCGDTRNRRIEIERQHRHPGINRHASTRL